MTSGPFRSFASVLLLLLFGAVGWHFTRDSTQHQPSGTNTQIVGSQENKSQVLAGNGEVLLDIQETQWARQAAAEEEQNQAPIEAQPEALEEERPLSESDPVQYFFEVSAVPVDWHGEVIATDDLRVGYEILSQPADGTGSVEKIQSFKPDSSGTRTARLELADAGEYSIAIWISQDSLERKGWAEPFAVHAGALVDVGRLKIYSTQEKYPVPIISGRVRSETEEPIANLMASLSVSRFVEDPEPDGSTLWPARESGQVVFDEFGNFEAFGPSNLHAVDLTLMAPGYEQEFFMGLAVPRFGLQVLMRKRLRLKGTLLVPAHGPPVQSFGVWISQEGRGTGVSPRSDGRFSAVGTSAALEIKVCHPSMGMVLFREEFLTIPSEKIGIGVVDLTDLVRVLDLLVVDAEGEPLRKQDLTVRAEGVETVGGQVKTDEEGRLLTVVPLRIETVQVSTHPGYAVNDQNSVTVDLAYPPSQINIGAP